MHAQWHAEFEELCALAASGELSTEERARLDEHLAYCDTCRQSLQEYERIASEIMPAIGTAMENDAPESTGTSSPLDLERGEKRLREALDSKSRGERKLPKYLGPANIILIAASLAAGTFFGFAIRPHSTPTASAPSVPPSQPVPPLQAVGANATLQPDAMQALAKYRSQIDSQEHQLQERTAGLEQSQAQIAALKEQLRLEQDNNSKAQVSQAQLANELAVAKANLTTAQDQTKAAMANSVQTTLLQQQVNTLRANLENRDRDLAENNDLLSHDRDIRDLIGARDLLIAEIYDASQSGPRNKPFGRLFYTKDKSLIFYGYDLDKQSGLKKSVAFQAWGGRENGQDVSLGLFYQDDTKKRWVLKFNDPKTLAKLNSVFVTVEPEGGSSTPTGKRLLMASLKLEPNHP